MNSVNIRESFAIPQLIYKEYPKIYKDFKVAESLAQEGVKKSGQLTDNNGKTHEITPWTSDEIKKNCNTVEFLNNASAILLVALAVVIVTGPIFLAFVPVAKTATLFFVGVGVGIFVVNMLRIDYLVNQLFKQKFLSTQLIWDSSQESEKCFDEMVNNAIKKLNPDSPHLRAFAHNPQFFRDKMNSDPVKMAEWISKIHFGVEQYTSDHKALQSIFDLELDINKYNTFKPQGDY